MRGGTPEGIPSQIFAIGGGELDTRETFEVDNLIVNSSGRARPWTICVPAASNDSPETCNAFGMVYGDALRCRTDYLRLIKGEPGGDDYQRKISRNEIFYFPDGDLDVLMGSLNQFGVIDELRTAYARGAVFAGVGAGAAALGQIGFMGKGSAIPGVGLETVGIGCLPQGMELSDSEAATKFGNQPYPSFILEYMTTLHVQNGKFRMLTREPGGKAHVVVRQEVSKVESKLDFESLSQVSLSGKAGP